jgi:hypothetical protein
VARVLAIIGSALISLGITNLLLGYLEAPQAGTLIVLGLTVGLPGTLLARRQRRKEQTDRDRDATRLAETVECEIRSATPEAEVRPFVLYLRPFRLSSRLSERSQLMMPGNYQFFSNPSEVQFDELLQICLKNSSIPVVCLGVRDEAIGSGRIPTDDAHWQERFRLLADRATGIAVVPGLQPGIVTEIQWLRVRGLFWKTVFFKPREYQREDWDEVVTFFEDTDGIKLPPFRKNLVSFHLYDSGRYFRLLIWKFRLFNSIAAGRLQMAKELINKE